MKYTIFFLSALVWSLSLTFSTSAFSQDDPTTSAMSFSGIRFGFPPLSPPPSGTVAFSGGVMSSGNTWSKKPGLAIDIASSCVIGTTNELYAYTNGNWEQMSENLDAARLAYDPIGRFWGVKTNGDLFLFEQGHVRIVNTIKASDVAVGKYGKIWITAADQEQGIYYSNDNGQSFTKVPGTAVRIDASDDGHVWIVNQAGEVFHAWDQPEVHWGRYPGVTAQDIGLGNRGTDVWITAVNDEIYHLKPCVTGQTCSFSNRWVKIDGLAEQVSVSGNTVWVVNENGEIYERQSN